jgi:hypothetical protein
MTMLVDPALEIERGQWSHRAGPVDGQWMERAPSISERPARTGRSAATLARMVAVLACIAACPGALSAAEDASTPAGPATASPPAAEPSDEETAEAPAEGAGQPEGSQPLPASLGLIEVIPAVWYERDLRFAYIGHTTYYSCSGLKSKVIQILEQMGVKPGFKVTIGSCYEGTRAVQPMPSVRIHAFFPTAATADVLAELQKSSPERELIRRAQGLPTDFDPALDTFAAIHTTVLFKDGRLGPIDPGDCELIETMRDQIFKPVGMKIIEDHLRCTPGELSMGNIFMKVEILEQPQPAEPPGKGKKDKNKDGERSVEVETDTPVLPP